MEVDQKSKENRLAKKIQASLAGKASAGVTLRVTLTGVQAEMWAALRRDAEGLGMDDLALQAALMDAGAVTLRKALKAIPR